MERGEGGSRYVEAIGHIFAGVRRAGASIALQSQRRLTRRPYGGKGKDEHTSRDEDAATKTQGQGGPVVNPGRYDGVSPRGVRTPVCCASIEWPRVWISPLTATKF